MSIITAENISKKYPLYHQQEKRHNTLRDVITDRVKDYKEKLWHLFHNQSSCHDFSIEDFWALKDVSFDIEQGDRVGIIGRNGAGKSTLLKVLSRITEPTEGRVTIRGRVASLLEVGTGFHAELTGRENIFLNGAILGMTRTEIQKKFDEIVAFAEVERFLDTPVKHYSSGMYVRLAFAVAAHLEPEILIVDEVLAVGDAEFQKKCLGKMDEIATKSGRTVLFVSHNIVSIKTLCDRALFLDKGRVVADGKVTPVVEDYLKNISGEVVRDGIVPETALRTGTGSVRLTKVQLKTQETCRPVSVIHFGQPFSIELDFDVLESFSHEIVAFVYLTTVDGTRFALFYNVSKGQPSWKLKEGSYAVVLDVNTVLLPHHTYGIDVGFFSSHGAIAYDFVEQVITFKVTQSSEDGLDNYPWEQSHAYIRPQAEWHSLLRK